MSLWYSALVNLFIPTKCLASLFHKGLNYMQLRTTGIYTIEGMNGCAVEVHGRHSNG